MRSVVAVEERVVRVVEDGYVKVSVWMAMERVYN